MPSETVNLACVKCLLTCENLFQDIEVARITGALTKRDAEYLLKLLQEARLFLQDNNNPRASALLKAFAPEGKPS